ncbi:SEC-C domain-containing protein, partial [bacterium]|nr:SEC-C domain-containing protein [bacterium]
FQNYFRLYKKLCGMTGTAKTEEREFREIYNLDVVVIPTNKENIRKDYPDAVYKTEKGKFKAVINLIKELHEKGQPVLVGTRSIEKSELLSKMLKTEKIPHQVLNAKYHEKEATIIAQAGRKGAVTIATNMAGRGVDILLGGNPPESDSAQDEVKKLGGLYIIGTERHESRRIDNQLRGRSGRQGDPGATKFFVSFEDELMRLFGAENISKFMDNFKLDFSEDDVIEHPFVTKAIENAQKKVEMRYFDMRKSVLDYDNVMNEQRTEIYGDRDQILKGEKLKESVVSMIENLASSIVDSHASSETHSKLWDYEGIIPEFADKFPFEGENPITLEELKKITSVDKLTEFVAQKAVAIYEKKESDIGEGLMRELERFALLRILDEKWIDHVYSMDILRDGIHLRAYGQKDPRIEYVNEAYQAFQELQFRIQEDTIKFLYRIKFRSSDEVPQQRQQRRNMHTNREGDEAPAKPYRRNGAKVGRNDLCPCGSGKKYKNCCGAK